MTSRAAGLLGDPRGGPRRVHVVRRVEHDEPVHPVASTRLRVDELDHLRVRPLPGDEPEPGADELQPRVRHRRAGQPQQRPRVLPVRPHRHAHRGATTSSPAPGTRPARAPARSCAMCAVRSPVAPHSDWFPSRSDTSTSRISAIDRAAPDGPTRPRPASAAAPRYPVSTPPCRELGVCRAAPDACPGWSPPRRQRTGPARRAASRAPRRGRAPCAMTLASSES